MDTNNHKGHRKRMREDFEKGGFKTWQKHNVLEYLLYNVIPVADTNDIAHNLIKHMLHDVPYTQNLLSHFV